MKTIKLAELEAVVSRINTAKKSPASPWRHEAGRNVANIGNYHLDGAYGGVSLHRMMIDGGGIEDVFRCGHITKRDLYERMQAFLKGLESATS
jgi:hypothetical protein